MGSKILSTFETLQTVPIMITSASTGLANANGRLSDVVNNTITRAGMAQVFLRTICGSAAPTANTPIKLYLIRHSSGSVNISDNALGTTCSGSVMTVEPTQAECLGSIIVPATAYYTGSKSFLAYDLSPMYNFVVWNGTGQTLNTGSSAHYLQVLPITPEGQ